MHQYTYQSHQRADFVQRPGRGPTRLIRKRADQTDQKEGRPDWSGRGPTRPIRLVRREPRTTDGTRLKTAWSITPGVAATATRTAWDRRQQTMSQAMYGARTVMTSNAFIRIISVITMLFSLWIYNWTMNNEQWLYTLSSSFFSYTETKGFTGNTFSKITLNCAVLVVSALCCTSSVGDVMY